MTSSWFVALSALGALCSLAAVIVGLAALSAARAALRAAEELAQRRISRKRRTLAKLDAAILDGISKLEDRERCEEILPQTGLRCRHRRGHEGNHTASVTLDRPLFVRRGPTN